MKKLLLFGCFILMLSCNENSNITQKPTFLIGEWKRLDDKPGNQTYETWNSNLAGMGYTITDAKKSFQETLAIITIKDTLYLEVRGVNEKPTLFKFTEQTDSSFVCENQQNKFPKRITYFLENKQLKAIVSSDDFRIDFVFDKIK